MMGAGREESVDTIKTTIFANPHSLPPSIGEGVKENLTDFDLLEITKNIQSDWRSQFTCSMFFVVAYFEI